MGGPRATELFSAVTAAAVAGVAALARSTEVVAEFAAALAARLEAAHRQVCYAYLFGQNSAAWLNVSI